MYYSAIFSHVTTLVRIFREGFRGRHRLEAVPALRCADM